MATAPPAFFDPSQIHLTMPDPPVPSPPPPPRAAILLKSSFFDILKIFVGLIIALILGAILVFLIFQPRKSNEIDLRESNEKIAKLQREAIERIALLQREQQLYLENVRQKSQENLTQRYRLEDRLIEKQYREQDLVFALEQSIKQSAIEEQRLQILIQERQLNEQNRKEDLSRENAGLLSDFIQELLSATPPLNIPILEFKIHSLIRRFDPLHKSLLISFLYKIKLLNTGHSNNATTKSVDLQGANLKDLDLDDMNLDSGDVGLWLNYTQLSLPSTNLINASLKQIYLNKADFSMCNMIGASLRLSEVVQTNFYRANLSLTDFRNANVSQSNFSSAIIRRASFQNADLTQAYMVNTDLTSTNFQDIIAIETDFSQSEISFSSFQYANLGQARMDYSVIRSTNFYTAKANQANFSYSFMPNCFFQWADLRNAIFRSAILTNTNFDTANVVDADFTKADLTNAVITSGQLALALSIAQAILPDGSRGKNKNLILNGEAQCIGMNGTIADWTNNNNVIIHQDKDSTECVFQARTINATLQQKINIYRYKPLIEHGQGQIYIEMQEKAAGTLNPSQQPAYINVRFFDSDNIETGPEKSSFNSAWFTPPSTFTAVLPCPPKTVELQLTVVFRQANATVDNIYVTIE